MICVDEVRDYGGFNIKTGARRHGTLWAHLWTNGDIEELHAFADRLGLRRNWFQQKPGIRGWFPHYDVTPGLQRKALALGAQLSTIREHYKEMRKRREAECQQ